MPTRMQLVLELRSMQILAGVPVTPINDALSLSVDQLIENGSTVYSNLSEGV